MARKLAPRIAQQQRHGNGQNIPLEFASTPTLTPQPRGTLELEIAGRIRRLRASRTRAFDDGRALFAAVCELGLEGVIAKRHTSLYRSGDRGWVKVKNPNHWRREAETEAVARERERRVRARA